MDYLEARAWVVRDMAEHSPTGETPIASALTPLDVVSWLDECYADGEINDPRPRFGDDPQLDSMLVAALNEAGIVRERINGNGPRPLRKLATGQKNAATRREEMLAQYQATLTRAGIHTELVRAMSARWLAIVRIDAPTED